MAAAESEPSSLLRFAEALRNFLLPSVVFVAWRRFRDDDEDRSSLVGSSRELSLVVEANLDEAEADDEDVYGSYVQF